MRKTPVRHGFTAKTSPPAYGHFYRRWLGMNRRCTDKKDVNYKNYGGRGIKVLWPSFKEFAEDMLLSFLIHVEEFGLHNTSIDRVNNDDHYRRGNCKWSTRTEQNQNQRMRKDNKSGIKNISWNKKYAGWVVQKEINKKTYSHKFKKFKDAKAYLKGLNDQALREEGK